MMVGRDHYQNQRTVRSFVSRAGRMTPGQKKAIKDFWPLMGVEVKQGQADYLQLFNNDNDVVLEIGFGMGDSLAQLAQQNPDKNYIGVEVFPPGVGRLMQCCQQHGLSNIKVYAEDGIEVLQQCIPDASLSSVLLFFPDPWPKKKHHKRRIVQADFTQLVRRKLKLGGVFHMATDWAPYAEHMMSVMVDAQGYENCAEGRNFCRRPESRPVTKFERRGERLGHKVADLMFRRVS